MFARNWRFLVALVALVAIAGCADQTTGPETFSVTGTVTQNGTPVDGATVTFSPKGTGNAASGTTDSSGNYTLTTFEDGDGAIVGSYAVSIRKFEEGPKEEQVGGTETDEDLDAAYAVRDAAAEEGEEVAEAKGLLPAKYGDPNQSGFTAEVTADGENNFPFDMTD